MPDSQSHTHLQKQCSHSFLHPPHAKGRPGWALRKTPRSEYRRDREGLAAISPHGEQRSEGRLEGPALIREPEEARAARSAGMGVPGLEVDRTSQVGAARDPWAAGSQPPACAQGRATTPFLSGTGPCLRQGWLHVGRVRLGRAREQLFRAGGRRSFKRRLVHFQLRLGVAQL